LVDTKNKYLIKTARNISPKGLVKSSAVLLPVNTVLFSSRATIGDISIAKIEVCTNQGYKNFVCNHEKIHFEYLYQILKRDAKNIEELGSGMTYPEISKTLISEYKIPLPSKNIQKKIISEIGVLEKTEKKAFEKIEKIKNDISKIISDIPKSKKENLGNIATIIAGQSPESKFYNEIEKGLPFYQGKLDFTDTYLSSPNVWTTKVTKEAIKGDILMSVRAPVGDVNLNPFDKICIGRGLCAIRTNGKLLQHFLWTYLKSIKEGIIESGNQGATFKAITKSQIENLKIPIPSTTKQKQIVSKIEKIENQITEIEQSISRIPKEKDAILKKYLE
jgi:type I restriction enzyme M protein